MAAKAASTPQKHPAPKVAFSMLMVVEMRFACFGKQILLAAEKLCVKVNSNSTGGEDDGLALFSCTRDGS
jgi:hypothetical protein